MYIIQWTVICWGMGIVGYQQLNSWQVIAMIPVVIATSLLTQQIKDKVSHWYSKQNTTSFVPAKH